MYLKYTDICQSSPLPFPAKSGFKKKCNLCLHPLECKDTKYSP